MKRLFLVGFWGELERKSYFDRLISNDRWAGWEAVYLDHTYRPGSRSRPDFFPAFYYQHDDYIRDKKWIWKSGLRMFLVCPFASIVSILLDYSVARHRAESSLRRWEVARLTLRGYATLAAKLMYGRSLGVELSPGDSVVLFGSNHPSQRLLKAYCDYRKIRHVFIEHGSLSGTLHLNPENTAYGLFAMRRKREFLAKRISEEDTEKAESFLDLIRNGDHDQKPQSVDVPLLKKLSSCRSKVLFLPGLGIVGGGFSPRISKSSREVSRHFRSNEHLLSEVLRIARRNDWTVVYKPHPNSLGTEIAEPEDGSLFVTSECSIPDLLKVCDGVVCLGTKVTQTALTLGKPVLLAGAYTLSGMGCCYEVNEKEELEGQLKSALEQGMTESQRSAYLEYAARELRYCLYQYKDFTVGRFGRDAEALSMLLKSYFEDYSDSIDDRFTHPLVVAREE